MFSPANSEEKTEALPEGVKISKKICQNLAEHIPDINTAFTPGVDVRGNKVAPADLGFTPSIKIPETLDIHVTRELLVIPPVAIDKIDLRDVYLGKVTFDGDQVYFNGQPLMDPEVIFIKKACRAYYQKLHRKIPPNSYLEK